MKPVVIVDVDGTVALMGKGEPGRRGPFDWHRVGEDTPNEPVIRTVRALWNAGHEIVYLSGRDESCRAVTEAWLGEHVRIHAFDLHMRPAGDNRKDSVVKREIYEREIAGKYEVLLVLDDRAQVVRMWRDELGLTVLQVADGDF